jgi:lysophospholipase L1-like esterase
MRKSLPYLVLSAWILMSMSTPLQNKRKVLFFGDSITQAGVNEGGYIRRIDTLIAKAGLSNRYETIGKGIGGNKIYDLYLRMDADVLALKPDIAVVYVGVNDVWHKSSYGTGTDFDKFGRFYEAVVKRMKSTGIRVIVATPAVIGERTDHSNEQDGDLNLYSQWIRRFAADNGLTLVDLRKTFLDYNLRHNASNSDKGILTTDRVHLNAKGNQVVAEAMWEAIRKEEGL